MSTESLIQVAPDSTGKKLRTLQVNIVVSDPITGVNTPATVELQVASIVDANGQILDLVDVEWKQDILNELRIIRASLWEMVGRMVLPGPPLS